MAAVLLGWQGEILLCRRAAGDSHSLLWEFPGGKLESGESPEQCIRRECREELGIEIRVIDEYMRLTHREPGKTLSFIFFLAVIDSGTPAAIVHDAVRWVRPQDFANYAFCPADLPVAERLKAQSS